MGGIDMKKRGIIIISTVALFSICSATVFAANRFHTSTFDSFFNKVEDIQKHENEEVAVTVNGEKIYQSTVNLQLEYSKLSYLMSVNQLESKDIPEEQKQQLLEKIKSLQQTEDGILNQLIKESVILQEAERQGITFSDEEAMSYALEQFALVKNSVVTDDTSPTGILNYEFFKKYIAALHLTEEQYIDKAAEAYKRMFIIKKFNETIAAVNQTPSSIEESNLSSYVDSLLSQAEIVYMK